MVSAVYALCFIQEYVTEERMPKSQGRPASSAGSSPPSFTTRDRSPRAAPLIEKLTDTYVYRVDEFEALKASILREGLQRLTAITSALKGAGGYGKTTLAQALCHDAEIIAAFPDGIEWVTLGEAPTTSELVDKMKAVIYRLRQTRLPIESLEVARAELRAALEGRSLLLVLDDVWRTPDLKPFLEGGPGCARLITTRNEGVLPLDIPCIPVDAMSPEESVQLLYAQMGTPAEFQRHEKAFYELARRLKEWPLLLALANGILRNRVKRHQQAIADALRYLNHALDKRGLVAFDPSQPQERHQAIGLTLEVSFALLSHEEHARYLKLAIFPENIPLPFAVIHRLWRTVAELEELDTEETCLKLYELSLLRSCDLIGRQAQLHDVIRSYLRIKTGRDLSVFQQQFLNTYGLTRWADLPVDEAYLWKYLIPHLIESGELHGVQSTVTDLRYLAKKVYVQHSAYAAEADIELAETILSPSISPESSPSSLSILRLHLARISDLLHACKTLQEVESTFLAYVYHVQDFSGANRAFQQEIARPFLIPWHPLSDTRDTSLIRTLHGHTGPVKDCAVSADGTWIVSASEDRTLKLWDVHTGALRFTLEGHTTPVTSCAITPRGNRIISASSDGTIKVWNAYTGNELLSLSRYKSGVTRCAMSPDGNWFVSASEDTTLKVWDIGSINAFPPLQRYRVPVIRTLRGHKGAVRSCAISPDGTWIASVSDDWTLRLWDARTGEQLSVVEVEMEEDALEETIYDCAIGPDGTWLAFTYSLGLRVWDVATSRERFTTFGHVGVVIGCAISPDGRWMLSTSTDGTLKGWSSAVDTDIFILKGHADTVNRCAISPAGDWVVSASDDHTLKLWQVPPISQERLPDEEEYAFGLVSCAVSPTGTWAISVTLNGDLKRWDVETGTEQEILPPNAGVGAYATCAISPDDTWFVTGSDEQILKTWDTRAGKQLLTLSGHTGAINDCAVSPDGTWIVSASDDQTLKVWNARTAAVMWTLAGHTGAVNACAIRPDGTWIVSGADDQTLRTWNMMTGTLRHTFSGHTGRVRDCAITPSGDHIVSASDDGTVRIWNANIPDESPVTLQHDSAVQRCAISLDGGIIVSLVGAQVKLWDRATGACLSTFYAHNAFSDGVFLPDGRHLIIAAENGLYFFRILL